MAKPTKRKCPACNKTKTFRSDQKTCGCKTLPVAESDREVYLRKEVSGLRTQLEKAQSLAGFQQEVADRIMMAVSALDPLPILPYKAGGKAESEMAAVLQLSDWHIGEVIDRTETGTFGFYNYATAQERAEYITDKFIAWLHDKQRSFRVPKVYIFGQADWVSGDIHKELRATNEFPLPVQAVKSGELLARIVAKIAPHAPELHFIQI